MSVERIWQCKIGAEVPTDLPTGLDHPMRAAVERAFMDVTGEEAAFTFSGWGAELTEEERAVVENRMPQDREETDAERAANTAEAALLGTEPRRGIWTDRDYLVHVLAILTDSDRALSAALAASQATNAGNLRPRDKRANNPWWTQFYELATELSELHSALEAAHRLPLEVSDALDSWIEDNRPDGVEVSSQQAADAEAWAVVDNFKRTFGNVPGMASLSVAPDEICVLVDGLRDYERKLDEKELPADEDPALAEALVLRSVDDRLIEEGYQVVIGFKSTDDFLMRKLAEAGLELFPVPVLGDDLPTYGIRAKNA